MFLSALGDGEDAQMARRRQEGTRLAGVQAYRRTRRINRRKSRDQGGPQNNSESPVSYTLRSHKLLKDNHELLPLAIPIILYTSTASSILIVSRSVSFGAWRLPFSNPAVIVSRSVAVSGSSVRTELHPIMIFSSRYTCFISNVKSVDPCLGAAMYARRPRGARQSKASFIRTGDPVVSITTSGPLPSVRLFTAFNSGSVTRFTSAVSRRAAVSTLQPRYLAS